MAHSAHSCWEGTCLLFYQINQFCWNQTIGKKVKTPLLSDSIQYMARSLVHYCVPLGKLNGLEHLLRWKLESPPKSFILKSFLKKLQSLLWNFVQCQHFSHSFNFVCSLIGATIKIPLQGKWVWSTFLRNCPQRLHRLWRNTLRNATTNAQ